MQLNTLGLSGLGVSGSPQWYKAGNIKLNNVSPSFIHDYAKNRYYNTTDGATGFPFTATRTSNATMFNSAGELVWAPHNYVANTVLAGVTPGIMGSGAVMPTTWNWSAPGAATGITREIIGTGTDDEGNPYIELHMYGTNDAGATVYPHVIFANSSFTAGVVTQFSKFWSIGYKIQKVSGAGASLTTTCRPGLQWITSAGSYISQAGGFGTYAGWDTLPEGEWVTARCFGEPSAHSTVNRLSGVVEFIIPNASTVDFRFRISQGRAGRTDISTEASTFPYVRNTSTSGATFCHRLDHNSATLTPRGYLIEAQRTNLMPISTGTPANWTASYATVTTAGTRFWNWDAITITTNSTAGSQFAYFTTSPGSLSASTRYTSSIFLRKNNYSLIQVSITNNVGLPTGGDWAYANYDFDSDTLNVYGTAGAAVIGSREILSDGIVRVQISYTTDTAPTAGAGVLLSFVNTVTSTRLSGTSTLGAAVDVFGAQLEAGNFATSHIPTYGVTATRNGETATLVTPPPYSATGTTYYAEFERQGNPVNSSGEATSSLFYFGDTNTYINGVFGFGTANQVRSDLGNAGAVQAQVSVSSQLAIPFQVYTWATRHAPNDSVMAANGVLGTVDTAVSMPSSIPTTRLAIGRSNSASTQQMHGWLRELRIYETAAPDGELITVTS